MQDQAKYESLEAAAIELISNPVLRYREIPTRSSDNLIFLS